MIDVDEILAREREAFTDGLMDTLVVMTYELGAVAQNLMYAKNEKNDSKAKNSLHANALLEVADLVTQASILHAKIMEAAPDMIMKPSWDELVQVGRERMLSRMDNIIEGQVRAPSMR